MPLSVPLCLREVACGKVLLADDVSVSACIFCGVWVGLNTKYRETARLKIFTQQFAYLLLANSRWCQSAQASGLHQIALVRKPIASMHGKQEQTNRLFRWI